MVCVYSNEDLLRITGCQSISVYAQRQQLKWLAHCIRMENNALQKITLFMNPTKEKLSINKEPSRDKIRIGPATECMYVWRASFEPDVT